MLFLLLLSALSLVMAESDMLAITEDNFHTEIGKGPISMVYFNKEVVKRPRNFQQTFEASATMLKLYKVQSGWVDCKKGKVKEYCDQEDVENKVHVFKDGVVMLELELENMFDKNSIISNILQVVQLKEVPIIQNDSELVQFEESHKGKKDIIFTYQSSIGTYEHRAFMEVSFAFQSTKRFALTTETKTVKNMPKYDEEVASQIWVLRCREAAVEERCRAFPYRGAQTKRALTTWLQNIDQQHLVHYENSVPAENPFELRGAHTAIFLYEPRMREQVLPVAAYIHDMFYGVVGVAVVEKSTPMKTPEGKYFVVKKHSMATQHYLKEALTNDSAEAYVMKMALDDVTPAPNKPPSESEQGEEDTQREGQTDGQDDRVAEAAWHLRGRPVDFTHAPALTDVTFPVTIARDFSMVLFHLPFDARSQLFLREFLRAGELLGRAARPPPLVTVNCHDWTDVCRHAAVHSWPLVRVYRRGEHSATYSGALAARAVVSAARMFQWECPWRLSSVSEARRFMAGSLPEDAGKVTNVSVLALVSRSHDGWAAVSAAARAAHGRQLYGLVEEPHLQTELAAAHQAAPPALLVVQRSAAGQRVQVVPAGLLTSEDSVREAVQQRAVPVFPHLTSENFVSYLRQGRTLVLLFDVETAVADSDVYRAVRTLAETHGQHNYTFAYLDSGSPSSVGTRVLRYYDAIAPLPTVAIVDYKTTGIYVKSEDLTLEDMTVWLRSHAQGKLEPSNHLLDGDWKPRNSGYDFLGMQDKENAKPEDDSQGEDDDALMDDHEEPRDVDPESGAEGVSRSQGEEDDLREDEVMDRRHSRLFPKVKDRSRDTHPAHTEL